MIVQIGCSDSDMPFWACVIMHAHLERACVGGGRWEHGAFGGCALGIVLILLDAAVFGVSLQHVRVCGAISDSSGLLKRFVDMPISRVLVPSVRS